MLDDDLVLEVLRKGGCRGGRPRDRSLVRFRGDCVIRALVDRTGRSDDDVRDDLRRWANEVGGALNAEYCAAQGIGRGNRVARLGAEWLDLLIPRSVVEKIGGD